MFYKNARIFGSDFQFHVGGHTSLYYRVVVLVSLFKDMCYTVGDAVDWFIPPTA